MYFLQKQMQDRIERIAELEQHLTFKIARLSKLLDTHAARVIADTDLHLTDYRILMILNIFEPTTAADLGRLMVVDRAQISRTVRVLIQSGLVATADDPANLRKKLLSLTDAGRALVEELAPRYDARQDALIEQLSEQDLRGLNESIDKLSDFIARDLMPKPDH